MDLFYYRVEQDSQSLSHNRSMMVPYQAETCTKPCIATRVPWDLASNSNTYVIPCPLWLRNFLFSSLVPSLDKWHV